VARGSFYIALQGAVGYVVSFLTYVALTRILNPSEIGELPILSAAYSVFSTITLFSLGTATTQYVARFAGSGRGKVEGVTSTALKIVTVFSVPGFLALALISPELTKLVFGTALSPSVLVLVIFAAVIVNFGTVLVAALWGLNLFGQMVTANIVGIVASRVIGVLFAASPLRLEGYFVGWIVGNALMLFIAFAYARPHLSRTRNGIPVLTMLVYSYPILFSALVSQVQQWADVTILYGLTGSLLYTGAYYLGLSGGGILSPVSTSIANAIFPTLSSKHGRVDASSFRGALRIAVRAMNVLVIPASLGLAAIASTAVRVAFGGTYSAATIPFAILIIAGIFNAYQGLMSTVLQSITRTQPLIKIASVGAVTEVVSAAALVVPFGVVGSAVARLGMVLVSLLLTYWYVKGVWWPSLDRQQLMKCLALSVICGVVLLASDSYLLTRLAVNPLQRLMLDAGLFVIVYVAGLVALKPLYPEDIALLKTAIPSPLHRPLRTLETLVVQKAR
jgi:O-antigen/teichoic acid export membrane protein